MDKCNPDLIKRLWARKGYPGVLREARWGVTVYHWRTIYGTLSSTRPLKEKEIKS